MSYPEITHLVAGKAALGAGRSRRSVTNPATAEVLGTLPEDDADLLEAVAQSAWRGFMLWRKTAAVKRADILKRAAGLFRRDIDVLARIITLEQGKVLQESRNEIFGTAAIFEWLADDAQRIAAEALPRREDGFQQTIHHEPVGPMLAIAPWNMPALLTGRKMAHALAVGCSVIVKPASETPGIAMALAARLLEAGLPPETVSVIHGNSGRIAECLIAKPQIRKLSFTGSTEVGRSLGALCGQHIKRFTAELGGHAPVIVLADADLAKAVPALVSGKFFNAGQSCMAPTRFYVHESRVNDFAEYFIAETRKIKTGNGLDAANRMGSLINTRAAASMQTFVDDAKANGAKLATGGKTADGQGSFYLPTVLVQVPDSARIMYDEPYGPLAPISSFTSLDEVICKANALPFGLCAYAFGQDAGALRRLTEDLEAGLLGLNSLTAGGPMVPFGGVKDSGIGREGSRYGLHEHMVLKAVTSNV